MARSKKILITSETHEKAVLKRSRQTASVQFCGECGQEAETLSLNEAAALLSVPWTEIISRIASGEFHSAGSDERCLAICVRSLRKE
ncbi:MAG: hypothetical protein J5I65_13440 [Aridibacter famidurans]|nr:hypothetical protein [Aridibacter famidurans]